MHINHFSDLGTNSEPTTRHFAPTQTFSSTQRYCNLHRHFNLQQTFRPSTDISSCHRHFHLSKDIATSTDISICNRHFATPQTFRPTTSVAQCQQFPGGRIELLPRARHVPTALAPGPTLRQERVAYVRRLAQVTAERLACMQNKAKNKLSKQNSDHQATRPLTAY